jgi:hypothetical protein
LDDFEVWLKFQRSRISAKSHLGEKLSYIAKYMAGLKMFLPLPRLTFALPFSGNHFARVAKSAILFLLHCNNT